MLKIILLLTFFLLPSMALSRPSQQVPAINEAAREFFEFTQMDVESPVDTYRIFIARPKVPAPEAGYPVLYLLDGNAHLPLAVNLYSPDIGSPPLIVGIGYPGANAYFTPERTRDYTFPATGDDFAQGGGCGEFYQFIEEQLKPLVTQKFSINANKQTLMGHSFGGVFTLYAAFNHGESYQRYLAASPALWWGKGAIIPAEPEVFASRMKKLVITVGELEERPNSRLEEAESVRQRRLALLGGSPGARDIAEKLAKCGWPVEFYSFAGKSHGGSVPDAIRQALILAVEQ